MRTIIAAVCVCVASIVQAHDPAGHAKHHDEFYRHLKIPGTVMSCCNNQDCRPAKYRITSTGVEMEVAGRWIMTPQSRVIEHIEATESHWCGVNEDTDSPKTFCAIIPRQGS
jgi:hypothetical protein